MFYVKEATVRPGRDAWLAEKEDVHRRNAREFVRDPDRAKVDRFGKELAPLVTSGPPGVTGFAGGRPQAREVLGYWPALIAKDLVHPVVTVEEV